MNRDDFFVNFLPEEYLPKPEWRSFPLVAMVILILVGVYIFVDYQQLASKQVNLDSEITQLTNNYEVQRGAAARYIPIQAKSRAIHSYLSLLFSLRMANPPWAEIQNRVEEILPEGVWIQNFRYVQRSKGWPAVSMTVVSAGTSYSPIYNLHINLLQKRDWFRNVSTTGFTTGMSQGQDILISTFTFELPKSI